MPELADIMLVVAQRNQIQIAFRRFAAHQRIEAIRREHLTDRAQPVGAFRMSRRRVVVEAGRMGQEKGRHAGSRRANAPFEKGLT